MTTRRIASLSLAGMALAASLFTALPAMAQNATPKVQIKTSMGDIVLELNEAKAPKTVANFMQYVRDKHYDGTVFHRVMDGFMIQGGGMDASLKEKPTRAPIPLEADNGLKNDRGTIAMARTGNPNSATSQFFINVRDNVSLDPNPSSPGYTVFGKVVSGMDVINQIKAVPTTTKAPYQNVPVTPVVITSATLIK
jgi:peptidyl-prolyl cis-trans isomerase A (cyclophilin A)